MQPRHFLDVSELKSLGATIAYAFEQLEFANGQVMQLQAELKGVKEELEALKDGEKKGAKA